MKLSEAVKFLGFIFPIISIYFAKCSKLQARRRPTVIRKTLYNSVHFVQSFKNKATCESIKKGTGIFLDNSDQIYITLLFQDDFFFPCNHGNVYKSSQVL